MKICFAPASTKTERGILTLFTGRIPLSFHYLFSVNGLVMSRYFVLKQDGDCP